MTPHVVIAVKPFAEGKSRLAGVLDDSGRAALNRRLFDHVRGVVAQAWPTAPLHVVSREPSLLGMAGTIRDMGGGLNAAWAQARATLPDDAAMIALSADLPWLTVADVAALAAAMAQAEVVLAGDAGGTGTNALGLSPAGAIPFSYGPGSLAAHRAAASAAGRSFVLLERPGLARDLDMPADLTAARAAGLVG